MIGDRVIGSRLTPGQRRKAALIAGVASPLIARAGCHLAVAGRGAGALRRGRRQRPSADHRVLARSHPSRHRVLPGSRHRGHHQPELRRRVDRADHPAVRLWHRARFVVSRRARALCRCGAIWLSGRPVGVHARRSARARACRAAGRRLARRRDGPAAAAVASRGEPCVDDEELGSHAGAEAVCAREPGAGRTAVRGRHVAGHSRTPASGWASGSRRSKRARASCWRAGLGR